MKMTYEEFMEKRQQLVDSIMSLNYENDPHIILMTGAHDEVPIIESISCGPFMIKSASELLAFGIQVIQDKQEEVDDE